jgi:hypothetical protein
MLAELRKVPAWSTCAFSSPSTIPVAAGRRRPHQGLQGGYTERDIATSLLNILSGSTQLTPQFFLNWNNGVNYNIVAQTPQYNPSDARTGEHSHLTAPAPSPGDLGRRRHVDLAATRWPVINHYNIRRTSISTATCRAATSAPSAATSSAS